MVHYKLTYFDLRGRGEVIRLILTYNNIPFEERRVDPINIGGEWATVKPTIPFGKLPVFEFDGKVLAESYAIYRYLARKYGLGGKDEWESAQLDAIADAQVDFWRNIIGWYLKRAYNMGDGDLDKLYQEQWPSAEEKHYPKMVELLKESGSGFFAKSGLTWVDFLIAEQVLTFSGFCPDTFKKYPELIDHMKRIHGLPQLKGYIGKRKNTPT